MNEKLFSLPVITSLSSSITERRIDELPVIVVEHPKLCAAVTLQGAQLIAWQPAGEQPVIWLSEKTAFRQGKAIRGGVPICWPWFGPAGEPAHGFARNLPWTLAEHHEDDKGVMLTLMLESSTQSQALWPHDFTLYARFYLAEQCKIELEAHGDYSTTAALHSYFAVSDIANVEVSGLGHTFIDKVNQGVSAHNADGKQRYSGRIDRVYTQPENSSIIDDPGARRQIVIHHQGQSDVVTWNPGAELSATMTDMADDGYQTMVCVETAHVTTPMQSSKNAPARLSALFQLRRHPSSA